MKKMKLMQVIILFLFVVGCSEQNMGSDVAENDADISKRTPLEGNLQSDSCYDIQNTIYSKDFYKDYLPPWVMDIRCPEVNLQEDMEDYFKVENHVRGLQILADMFFDNRTIEMEEEELNALFYSHGYYLYLHNTEVDDLHIRIVEIQEMGGLSLYPSVILIQTWDDEHIYLEDITGPVPRKVRSILTIDDKENPQMIIHSSGLSVDYISEEELSFWEFQESYWTLIPMELDIDTSHAYFSNDYLYSDSDNDELFPIIYYPDGIVFRACRHTEGRVPYEYTYYMGKLEEVERNKSYKLMAVEHNDSRPIVSYTTYIQITVQ